MGKKITTIYQTKWTREPISSTLAYLRDLMVNLYPFKRLPEFLSRFLYGGDIQFVFFIHPRRTEDIFVGMPFLTFLKYILPRPIFAKFFSFFPPIVLEKVQNQNGMEGLVVSGWALPEWLMKSRRGALRSALLGFRFSNKIMKGKYFGLGGLWPVVTRRGLALSSYARKMDKVVTNGHCGTALSIYLTVRKIASLAEIPLESLSLAVVGVGKMGANLARIFASTIGSVTLIDINDARLRLMKDDLQKRNQRLHVETLNSKLFPHLIQDTLLNCHLAICASANVNAIIKPVNIPQHFIIVDDSRPEAIPRVLDNQSKIVLEGGLMRIRGIKLSYDYGFGIDENVFGCFAETYMLALAYENQLEPTLGDVREDNFFRMKDFCHRHQIEVGSFMSSSEKIADETIRKIIQKRHEFIASHALKKKYV